jgi:hypothetical protein
MHAKHLPAEDGNCEILLDSSTSLLKSFEKHSVSFRFRTPCYVKLCSHCAAGPEAAYIDCAPFICISSREDSVSSFVHHDLLEVCLLSQSSDVATPIRLITERHSLLQPPLPAAPTAHQTVTPAPRGQCIGLTLLRLNDTRLWLFDVRRPELIAD